MKKILIIIFGFLFVLSHYSFNSDTKNKQERLSTDSLRNLYSGPKSYWPKPFIDSGIQWEELGLLPRSPVSVQSEDQKELVALGKSLFYDPRLSGSNQISCISCHAPEMHWSDGRQVSLGHDQMANSRNAPSLENVWFYKSMFWDGRAKDLEEQSEGPISSEIEMHQDLKLLPRKLSKINGYKTLFTDAFGDSQITQARIAKALATYQMTFTSRKSDFDYFLEGKSSRLSDQQINGLHLFRTKARCMNCHHGPLFTDNEFHNLGLTYYGRDKYEDLGRYNITRKPEDVGKFRTPGLRNVMNTKPWFHNGLFDSMEGVINMYNAGMARPKPKADQVDDPLFPKTDVHLQKLGLTTEERAELIAFLEAITTQPWRIKPPELPR